MKVIQIRNTVNTMKKIAAIGLAAVLFFTLSLSSAMADRAAGTAPVLREDGKIIKGAFVFELLKNGNLKLVEYTDKENMNTVNIPGNVDGQQVEQIGGYAFVDCQAKTITIPNSVTLIETCAFDNCSRIEKISVPNTVLYLDGNPFTGCRSLVNISLDPKHPTLQVTSDGALYSKKSKVLLCYPCSKKDVHVSVKPGTVAIGKNAFRNCDMLETITLPDTVTKISEGAFLGCINLQSITLPETLLVIEELAFSNCSSMIRVRIPEKVSRIERGTFFQCASLEKVTLSGNLTEISGMAFYGCTALQEIHLPGNLGEIEDKVFADCNSLTDIYIPVSVTKIGNEAFDNCSVRLYLHLDEYSYAESYARINDISFTYDTEDSFLTEGQQADAPEL